MLGKSYSGIGSRTVPEKVIEQILELSVLLAQKGMILRSGGADGADTAFEVGCDSVNGQKEIYLPWKGFNDNTGIDSTKIDTYDEAQQIAEEYHPAWKYLKHYSKKFHTRNVYQVLGKDLNSPVEFVVCYTQDGKASGGTGQAMRIAEANNIPIYNLYFPETYDNLKQLK